MTDLPAIRTAPRGGRARGLAVGAVAPAAAIVLRPASAGGHTDPVPTSLWPLLVLVLADQAVETDPGLADILSLLDEERPDGELAFLQDPADWFVADGREPLIELAVHTSAYGGKDAVIALRARVLAEVMPLLANQSPVALTTAARAARLQGGVTARDVLNEVVVVGHLPSLGSDGWTVPGFKRWFVWGLSGERARRAGGRGRT